MPKGWKIRNSLVKTLVSSTKNFHADGEFKKIYIFNKLAHSVPTLVKYVHIRSMSGSK